MTNQADMEQRIAWTPGRDVLLSSTAQTVDEEWPNRTLDVEALTATGWRPVAFREFVLKLVGRCNLACGYCYIYASADQTWRTRPAIMDAATVRQAGVRIDEHLKSHQLDRVSVVLHGGEPLLAGAEGLEAAAATLRRHITAPVTVDLRIQTNAVLLTEDILRVMHAHHMRVGVSLDGGPSSNDRNRRWTDGRGSYAETARGLNLLGRAEHRDLFAGLLCVVDLDNDPIDVYDSLLQFSPPAVDFLLPHGNWSSPPPSRVPNATATPYADWLIAIFDRWYRVPALETDVRLFQDIMNLLLGGHSGSEQVGLGPAAFLVIDTDGSLQQVDTLKSTFPGAPETGLNIFVDPIDAALTHPSVVARQIGFAALADACRGCDVVAACGGGHYVHRYQQGRGFRQPSVYCPDLMKLIRHIRSCLAVDLRGVLS